jgi:hypothetical protein
MMIFNFQFDRALALEAGYALMYGMQPDYMKEGVGLREIRFNNFAVEGARAFVKNIAGTRGAIVYAPKPPTIDECAFI